MLFSLNNVTKTYGKIVALRQLSVEVEAGAIGLLGPNGAGKTTLIRALLGLLTLDTGAGEILDMNIRTRRLDIRQAVGFMPEDDCLFPGVQGIEFVAYAGELLAQGNIQELKQVHNRSYEVRLKGDPATFVQALQASGNQAAPNGDLLHVQLQDGQSPALLWQIAADIGEQIRYLRPQRSTL